MYTFNAKYMEQCTCHFYYVFIALLKYFIYNRKKRMAKVDAFSTRRNIYYDQHGGKTMICSDNDDNNEEEVQENNEVKCVFS